MFLCIGAALFIHATVDLVATELLPAHSLWVLAVWAIEVSISFLLGWWLLRYFRRRDAAEQALREQMRREEEVQRFSSTFAGDIVWQYDASSGRHTWSESTARVLGYEDNSALMAPDFWRKLVHPDDAPRVTEQVRAAIESGASTCGVEYRFKVADGSYREFLDRGAFIRDSDGKVLRAVGVMHDVTELRERDRALSASDRRLRTLVEQSGALLFELDLAAGRITHIEGNQRARLGYAPEQWTTAGFWESILHEEDAHTAREYCLKKTLEGSDHSFQYRIVAADGSTVWIHDIANIVRDEEGRVVGLRGVMIDITHSKSLEADRRLLFDSSLDMLCVASFDGVFLDVNPAWTATLGWSREEILSRPWLEFVHPDDQGRTAIAGQQLLSGAPIKNFRNRYRTKCGKYRLLSWAATPDVGRRLIFGSVRDITNVSRQARLLEQTNSTARIGGWEVDLESQTVFWTDEVYRIYGYEPGELPLSIEQGIRGYVPEHQELVRRAVERSIGSGEKFDFEAQLITKHGERVWVQAIGQCQVRNGKTVRIYGSIQDISGRKAAERSLCESEDRHRMLLRQLPVGVMIHDGQTVRYANDSMARIFGAASADQLVNAPLFPLLPEEFWPLATSRCSRVMAGEPTIPNDLFRIDRPDGTHVFAETACALIHLGGVPVIQTTFVDVTQTIRDREAQERTNALQAMLLRELDHRVKNALMGLINLVDQTGQHAPSIAEFARSIRGRISAMAEAHALLSGGRWNPVPIRAILDRLMTSGIKGRVTIEGPAVLIPPRQATALAMVIQELLTNAAKHGAGSEEGGTISVRWSIEPTAKGTHVELAWTEDSDRPMPEVVSPRLGWGLMTGFTQSELGGQAVLRLGARGVDHRLTFNLDSTSSASTVMTAQPVVFPLVEVRAQPVTTADDTDSVPPLGAPAEAGFIEGTTPATIHAPAVPPG